MPLTLGTVTADPQTLKAALEQTVRYVNQLEAVIVKIQGAQAAGTGLTLQEIRSALAATGSHPLNVAGLPGTLTQNQRHTTP
jgi:hypothetical protein